LTHSRSELANHTQDSLDGYGSMWILKETVERTCVADKVKVGEMIHGMDIKDGAAMAHPGPVKFDAAGRRVDAPLVIAQWQNGVPVTVYPVDRAVGWQSGRSRPEAAFHPPHQHS
jgi:branched-chain amino acid transport system substrate-binding protein